MVELPNVSLTLSNRPENVLLVRQALSGLAEAIRLDPIELNDVHTAVTEACNNVVLHAYGGEEGSLEVEIGLSSAMLEIVVRDHGRGIRPRVRSSELADGGIGLPVIQALSHDVELRDLDGSGTEVRMQFKPAQTAAFEEIGERGRADGAGLAEMAHSQLQDTAEIVVAPAPLARSVLPRVLCSLAARAHFSTDRISDTQLLADALLAHLDSSVDDERLGFGIGVGSRELELRIGPLPDGRAESLLEACVVDGLGPVIERLTDGHQVTDAGTSGELLALTLIDHGGMPAGRRGGGT